MFCCTAQLVLVVNYCKFVMAHRPRRASQTKRIPRGEDLSGLNSEVLKLRLGALNLPVTGSKGQLQNRLKRALLGNSAKPRSSTGNSKRQKRTSSRPHVNARPGRSTRQNNVDWRNTGEIETFPIRQNSAVVASQEQEQEDSALSDHASLSSIEEMIESDLEIDTDSQQNTSFSSAQRSAIEEIVSRSVHTALNAFSTPTSALNPLASNPSSCTPGTASPLGLSRPVDRRLEDKILRGEYVDFALLLPDNLYQSQTPEIQLRLDDSSSGPMGSPVTMVRKSKPVIDTFQKWLDAYMVYMLVLVTAYPRRALELIKYQQIISRAVTKFKGLAWVSYDQQFRRRAAYDLSLSWDKVDLELWTVTFAGLAKPHCNVCSSPYHAEDVCPSADPNRKLRRPQTVCFDFNKSTGCRRRNCSYPHVCRRCHSGTHVVANCPQQQSSNASKISKPSDRGKK